jgi:hypothetical protein
MESPRPKYAITKKHDQRLDRLGKLAKLDHGSSRRIPYQALKPKAVQRPKPKHANISVIRRR